MLNHHIKKSKISPSEKEQRLLNLMNSVFEVDEHRREIDTIMSKLSISREILERTFLDYNMDVHSHDNAIYRENAIRAVLHLHNLIAGSWHQPRQDAVCELIALAQPRRAVDLGFGVPSRYTRKLLSQKNFHLTMCDFQSSAVQFAEVLLAIWDANWRDHITLRCENMENVKRCVSDYDLYISLHSIEHVADPTQCMRDYIQLSNSGARFLLEIPIGPITPEHNIEWATTDDAKQWLHDLGLKIIHERLTRVNPNIDLFAEPHDYNYYGYLILCEKIND